MPDPKAIFVNRTVWANLIGLGAVILVRFGFAAPTVFRVLATRTIAS